MEVKWYRELIKVLVGFCVRNCEMKLFFYNLLFCIEKNIF